jgi:5'-nucleotidase
MKILLSNDDGYSAIGIKALNAALSEIADTVVVAPNRNRSGASSSLTLGNPIRLQQKSENIYSCSGTPADCIHIARQVLFQEHKPDLVVCGINMGANLGDDVIYSGTVAGAIEGNFLGVPAMAISLVNGRTEYFEGAAKIAREIVEKGIPQRLADNQILNVNVPDVAYEDIEGFSITRQGHRHRDNVVITSQDPRGQTIYWLGPPQAGKSSVNRSDFEAIEAKRVSMTPLTVDLTAYEAESDLTDALGDLRL